jgi:hypothetical protein
MARKTFRAISVPRALPPLLTVLLTPALLTPRASGEATTPGAGGLTLLTETSQLHLIKSHGLVLNERGAATGTFACRLAIRFRILSATRGVATLTAYPPGGSITGRASAGYTLEGSTGHFSGSLTITHGTGAFLHVYGKDLRLEGTIDPNTLGLSAQLTGQVRL